MSTHLIPFVKHIGHLKRVPIRRIALLFFVLCWCYKAHALAQEIRLHAVNTKLEQIFREIEKQSGSGFFYKPSDLSSIAPISVDIQGQTLEQALATIFKSIPLEYTLEDKIIAVKPKKRTPTATAGIQQQDITITGSVKDASGPLSGVSVLLENTKRGTSTNGSGTFTIQAPVNTYLIFRSLGYEEQRVLITENSNKVDIILKASLGKLDEAVVVGYGAVKKRDITGSVASIKEEDIKSVPIASLDKALQGRIAGVQVTTNSAKPGGQTTIRIRGTGSINASNDPLYVIDGFPTGDLNSINPSDIASIEVLKDASATAIYGSRGSNGVVLVTTKRGSAGQSNISAEGYYGSQTIRHKIPLLNAQQYADFINEARSNGGGTAYFDGSSDDRPLPDQLGTGTDWQDVVFHNAPMQNWQVNFNGGDAKTQYALSGGYFDQDGIIVGSYFKRYSVRANVDRQTKSWLKVGLSMQGAHTLSNNSRTETEGGAAGGVTNAALNYAPVFPIYDANGVYYRDLSSLNGNLVDNPLGIAKEVTDQYRTIRFLGNAYAEVKFTPDLVLRSTFGADLLSTKSNYYASRLIALGASSNGTASVSSAQNINWLNENTLTYKHLFAEKHDLTALLGYTAQSYHNETVGASASNFNNDFALFNNLGGGSTLVPPSSGVVEWSLMSFLARVNYSYDNKYLLTLTARSDGSSRFGPNNKYGFFPSGALAWRLSNESFFKDRFHWIDDAKLRVSYGLTGNQGIADYAYLATIVQSTAVLGGPNAALHIGGVPNIISNLDLGWESNKQLDMGLDLSFVGNKLNLTADYYVKNTADLLFSVNVPQTTGYSTSLSNIGEVQNKGLELALSAKLGRDDGFKWSGDFNVSFNTNKIVRLDGRDELLTGSGVGHLQVFNTIQMKVGEPLGNFYGRVFDGIFQNQAEIDASAQPTAKPGDIRYKDLDDNGVINDNDRTVIGNGYPSSFAGSNNTFSYKGFDLNFFFQGTFGNDILNFGRFDLYNLNGNNNQSTDVLNRWTPENPSNEIPRANSLGGQRILSSFHIEDGSFIRLKNISLGYNLPKSLVDRIGSRNIKVYVSAQNMLTITDYKGYDPEVSRFGTTSTSQGMDYGGYPASKSFMMGINIGL
ncbi:TonB-dependent receptor [Olivibacter ginsenosidimutans]|uniref:TonB-dependent receptor n=1 Tax=Olivibacter ginsenosidimutans TaxID=1176537 RepID=A0ABP9AF25_9SPHI